MESADYNRLNNLDINDGINDCIDSYETEDINIII